MSKNNFTKTRVKTSKERKIGSTLWLQRQLNDPLVKQAKLDGYRSRAAYKIIEIDDKFKIFSSGKKVLDLGAAPGGWTQIAMKKGCKVTAIDLLEFAPIGNAKIIKGDFTEYETDEKYDIIMSDMAPNTTGDRLVDHLKLMALVEDAYYFAMKNLNKNGHFICKIFQGGEDKKLFDDMKKRFDVVKYFKPESSRKGSKEIYFIALNSKN